MKACAKFLYIVLYSACSFGISSAEWDTERRAEEIMRRVAEYARCGNELATTEQDAGRAKLEKRLEGMRGELTADNIDYESFIGETGRGEDIFGDWFFDGAWIANSVYWDLPRKIDPVRLMRKVFRRPRQADYLTAEGGVPDSAFFINTDIAAITPDDINAGDGIAQPRGRIAITGKKQEGQSKGFFGVDERGREYIFIVDPPGMEEQVTAAEVIGSTLARMAGYNVPCSTIVSIEGTGNPEFDGRRAVATRLVKGYRGHWSYRIFKNRREMRATKVFGAWLHNTDWVDHNTGISVERVDGFPLARYYVFDFGGALGSWNIRPKEPRDGWEHYVDFGKFFSWPVSEPLRLLGLSEKPYSGRGAVYSEAVGYFDSNVDPGRYRANYPNMAWMAMTRDDGAWAARLIADYTAEQIDAVVGLARYTRREDADYIRNTLLSRRQKILDYYNVKK